MTVTDKSTAAPPQPNANYWASSIPASAISYQAQGGQNTVWSTVTAQTYAQDVALHLQLLAGAGIYTQVYTPVFYTRLIAEAGVGTTGRTDQQIAMMAATYYDELDSQLNALEHASAEPNPPVERGAIVSSREIIRQLRNYNMAPPEITWHGGDAVVMLWEFTSMLWAMTVTDGEVGYVIRRDKKQVKIRDSIQLHDFKLLEMK